MSVRRAAVLALGAESVLGLAWCVALLGSPDLCRPFLPDTVRADWIRTFALADVVAYVAVPAAAAAGLAREREWALPVLWLHAGAVIYAALWGWGMVLVSGQALLGAALMTPPAVVMPWLAARLSR